jgi:hypothetical protein
MADKPRVALRALLFDVQGTATDFHSTVQAEATRISAGRQGDVDWSRFVDRWRAEYRTALESATRDQRNWTSVRSICRDALDGLLTDYPTIGTAPGDWAVVRHAQVVRVAARAVLVTPLSGPTGRSRFAGSDGLAMPVTNSAGLSTAGNENPGRPPTGIGWPYSLTAHLIRSRWASTDSTTSWEIWRTM